ncbi:hypothetical protein Tco_1248961 [Tanacetum coccineum]
MLGVFESGVRRLARVFVDRLEEGLSKTLAGEEIPIDNDLRVNALEEGVSKTLAGEEIPIDNDLRVNASSSKSIVAHTTLEYPEHSNFFLN